MRNPFIVLAAAAMVAVLACGEAVARPGGVASMKSRPQLPDTSSQNKLSDSVSKLKLPCLPVPRTNENPTGRSRLGCR